MQQGPAQDIKHNCDASDAQFWGFFSICGLLMRYRDLYRSEQGWEPWAAIPREAIAAWIQHKEAHWPELEQESFRPVRIGKGTYDAFDVAAINRELPPTLAYGAGYGMYLKPTFVLADLLSRRMVDGHEVLTTGKEHARDLFTSPAMLLDRTIFLRREPLKALLWDHLSQIVPGSCTVREDAFRAYGIAAGQQVDQAFISAFDRMVDDTLRIMLLHELAESAERIPSWKDLVAGAPDRKCELVLRAVQDLLADTSERGPLARIVAERDERALAVLVGLMEGFRVALFPDLRTAYAGFRKDRAWSRIEEVRVAGYARFSGIRQAILDRAAGNEQEGLTRLLHGLLQERSDKHAE